jgi:branched-subunit amino acid transport protein AzlD
MSLTIHSLLIIAVTAACIFLTRLSPFVLFGRRKEPHAIIRYLGEKLPAAVMAILIIYCLKDVDFSSANSVLPQAISIALVVILHLWKKSNILSIGAGTLCYMLLIQYIFA